MFLFLALLLYEVLCINGVDYDLSVDEDATVDTPITSFSSLTCLEYKIENLDGCCKINDSGFLQVAKSLDRETTTSYSGTLQCNLGPPDYITSYTIIINIDDVNDNSPEFSERSQTVTVDETSTVPVKYPLSGATDRDSKKNSVTRYELVDDTDKFEIETGSWSGGTLLLSLVVIKELDYDTGDRQFTLRIKAYDKDDKSDTMTLTVNVNDINDNKPEFEQDSYSGSVAEDVGTQKVVLTVLATDQDSGDNGEVVYSLQGNNLPFAIRNNGDIIVTRALNREDTASYTFQVLAQDKGQPASRQSSVSVVATVLDVNDNGPVIVSPKSNTEVELKENLPVGSIVCKVQISDLDAGDNSRISVTIKGGYSNRFMYAVKQGDIGQIVTKEVLDREETDSYTLIIQAQDHGDPPLSSEVQFNLKVTDDNDNKPSIDNCDQDVSVPENFVGKILEVKASDADTGHNAELLYSVTDTVKFEVDANGAVSVKSKFDYEVTKTTTLRVTVSDNSTNNPLSSSCDYTLVITDVNDNAPVFVDPGVVSVKEDVDRGSLITTLKANDVDTSDTDKLTFSLLGISDVFTVESQTGAVRNTALLDRETQDEYTIECAVHDSDGLHNDTIQLQIKVLDVSDTKPVFEDDTPYRVDLSELAPLDQVVKTAKASDQDLADTLTFSISSPYFRIDPNTGEICVSNSLTSVPSSPLTSQVSVSDGRFTTTTDLIVNVYKNDGRVPLLSPTGEKLSEAAEIGSTAGECSGTSSSPITYSLTWDNTNENYNVLFSIDRKSGLITTTGPLDYELYDAYVLTCTATNIHGQSADATLTVKVEGANEFSPEFSMSIYSFETFDRIDSETKVVGQVNATDADKGNDGILQYFLLQEVPGWLIKRNTGEIIQLKQTEGGKKKRSVDEENTSKRNADSSSSSPQYSSEVQLNVMVKDSPVNERDSRSANATVYIDINPYVGGNDQIVIIGAAAGGGLLLIILVTVVFVIVIRRKKAKSGSKELTFVNPTAYTGKDGRVVTTDGGYVSSEPDIILKDMVDIKRNANLVPYSQDELGTGYTDTPIYDLADPAYLTTSPSNYLNTRDKTVPHKMSVSTVLSDMRNDVQVSAIPHRLTGSVTRTGSYESVHVFGSEGGGEGDAVIDAHSLFNKLSEIDDDVSVINNKSTHFLGDQDSAFSSLGSGSSNAGDQVTTPYHTEYLQDWKPAFQSVGKICEGMLRNKQFAYKSNTSSSRHTSAENISPNLNAGSIPRDSPSANHHASNGAISTNPRASNGTISTNHHTSNSNISTSDRVVKSRDGGSTPHQHPGSVVSSYQGSREDVISSRPSNVSGHSNSPARSVGSC